MPCPVHRSAICAQCADVAAQAAHVCPLAPITEAEAVATLVGILRGTSSASHVVARLEVLGLRIGRRRT